MNDHIYQADHETIHTLQRVKEQLHHCCGTCLHREVRVQTLDGNVFEGTIVQYDDRFLYLSVPQASQNRAFIPGGFGYNPAANVILPLVLYELLVISLLY